MSTFLYHIITRASTLICACELIRKDCESRNSVYGHYALGTVPITIGLWIGGEHTPNTDDGAKKNLEKLRKATSYNLEYAKDTYNKFQVLKCPWCGTRMTPERDGDKKIRGAFWLQDARRESLCPLLHEAGMPVREPSSGSGGGRGTVQRTADAPFRNGG